ncbi:MAG: Vi polysaccharide biosynthesis UDP-N-acetylglucosamine C-6 dehydrogenase TviB [Candidatus Latescibacterota bacterium]|nr:MAG: Vi polysaccharide biosynthesis UDP-N-acetylglucosamine C-6 dehydrogenase TviB [Candidatus Latescibacterota bacterium]
MDNDKIAVIGLGYVGLPLAVEFGKQYETIGFDINSRRVEELQQGIDRTLETTPEDIRAAARLRVTTNTEDIRTCNVYIVTVPTPIDKHNRPDLTALEGATETVGKVLGKNDVVVYESTVYPGCTEEFCVPILERLSGLTFNDDFFCGYSPERINPGDKNHSLPKIKKVTSGSTPEMARKVDELYKSIITAGTHPTSSIKVAEAAKVIENSQRDINIAFVNELALIFERLGIDTIEVLEAAGSKWNFLPFRPGLVGGHCIGVDPYYLTHKAEEIGYHPEVILTGRRINDNMGIFIANKVVKMMIDKGRRVRGARVLVLGVTFKENCPDIRNSRVVDVVRELRDFGCEVEIHDPWAESEEVVEEYGFSLIEPSDIEPDAYDAVVLAVAHDKFRELDVTSLKKSNGVIFDVKSFLDPKIVDSRL